ncbi:oxygenase MpaB family protein [Corynebacterium terpenotabidum]|uniref:ER-bound oxygenase mpaB/mpaB'/Rubber oxygenase catalytic domain-containing protein n=1 Tax=Corynebacterium terpenotabidum Y-11 TaxID=1200352 RepID=S4XFJ6_9CORY|nr:oxygenase MpaB family protein [Corynebacterium terpenotabidum]AGP31331.1 hypothetical protein A606_08440 [Corynebacterium terpenotabidum Y-11]
MTTTTPDTSSSSTPTAAPVPPPALGADSILWQRFGDWRSLFGALYAGILQVSEKDISAALVQHSNVFDNEVARLVRSAFPIIHAVYEGENIGAMIRDYHRDIKGTHSDGTRYHSLNPAPFYWAHATFVAMPYVLAGTFMPAMTTAEKEQLFQESRTWYSYYGIAEPEGAPTTYSEYVEYMEKKIGSGLQRTETVDRSRILRQLTLDSPDPSVPDWLWRPIAPYAAKLLVWCAVGLLPQNLRDQFGWSWTKSDQRRFRIFSRTVRGLFTVLPRPVRMVPIAYRAIRRDETSHRATA